MDAILQGITGVICYNNDILVTGSDDEKHSETLGEVLKELKQHGLVLQPNKCVFMQESVEYLGHIVDAQGLHATPEKLQTIEEAPAPEDVNQHRSRPPKLLWEVHTKLGKHHSTPDCTA